MQSRQAGNERPDCRQDLLRKRRKLNLHRPLLTVAIKRDCDGVAHPVLLQGLKQLVRGFDGFAVDRHNQIAELTFSGLCPRGANSGFLGRRVLEHPPHQDAAPIQRAALNQLLDQ